MTGGAEVGNTELDRLGVEMVHWPRDAALRDHLARAGVPRLLIVAMGADAPDAVGVDEDWVRIPADEREIWTRAERLSRLSSVLDREVPVLHPGRIISHGGRTAVLSKSETIVVRLLLDPVGEVVSRQTLTDALWPQGPPPSGKALDALVDRLRRRLMGLHVCIRGVRSRGFVVYLDGP